MKPTHIQRFASLAFWVASLCVLSGHQCPMDVNIGGFEGCGVLVQGVECVLFQADAGGLFLLSNLGSFQVGERVEVRGRPRNCITICQQGNGCIEDNTIRACED